jgi:hypothetical protein
VTVIMVLVKWERVGGEILGGGRSQGRNEGFGHGQFCFAYFYFNDDGEVNFYRWVFLRAPFLHFNSIEFKAFSDIFLFRPFEQKYY